MLDSSDEDEDWCLGTPKLPQSILDNLLQYEKPVSVQRPSQNSAFFKLPPELRNHIYRFFVKSPLFCHSRCQIYRPVCVDNVIFKIGYFMRDTVLPLLLTCHRIHEEASSILYSENVFILHASSLSLGTLALFDLLSQRYLRLMRKVYILTECFSSWSLQLSHRLRLPEHGDKQMDRAQLLERGKAICESELEACNTMARSSLSTKYGFSVNCDDTFPMPVNGSLGRLQRDLKDVGEGEWWSSRCQLWKMIPVELDGSKTRQEFRRVVWTNDQDTIDEQEEGDDIKF